jgi:DNA-binding transcriptional ArsR family regulator
MVEYAMKHISLDTVFASLADATRRDILARVIERPRTIGELAKAHKKMSFAAIAKHVGVLESARLVAKHRAGRHQVVSANPKTIDAATDALHQYQAMWDARFSALDKLLKSNG